MAAKPLRLRTERTYSAPFAMQAYAKKPWNIPDGRHDGNFRACFMVARIYANPANVPEILRRGPELPRSSGLGFGFCW